MMSNLTSCHKKKIKQQDGTDSIIIYLLQFKDFQKINKGTSL
jgi:hypothetical protein